MARSLFTTISVRRRDARAFRALVRRMGCHNQRDGFRRLLECWGEVNGRGHKSGRSAGQRQEVA